MKRILLLVLLVAFVVSTAYAQVTNRRQFTNADEDAAFGANVFVESSLLVKGSTKLLAAASKVIGGATSFAVRNNADDNNNLLVTNAGAVTARTSLTAAAGDVIATNGNFHATASGKTLSLEDGTAASACVGTGTLTAATPLVIATTCINTGDYVFLTRTSLDADGDGDMYVDTIVDGVSFAVTAATNDTATINWLIIKGH